jgi:hypothetical protein
MILRTRIGRLIINEEDFQAIALLCREAIISLAQAVYKPKEQGSSEGVRPSETDAKRMLDDYIMVNQVIFYIHSSGRASTWVDALGP